MGLPSTILSQRTEEIINFDKRLFFILLVVLFLLIRYLTDELILQSIPGYRQLEKEGAFTLFYVFNTLNYLWTPFALLWKFTLIAFTLWIGAFMAGHKLSFRELWKFTMIAEIIFILPELIRLLWFLAVVQPESFLAIENFHPFSLFSLVNAGQIESRFHYPLKVLNIFEVVYWFILSIGVHTISRTRFPRSLMIVLGSYTLCFFLWLGFYIVVYK
ncbi:MAG: sulfate ABC transporter permease [Anditalea sp.]